jgi:hypothetical protein
MGFAAIQIDPFNGWRREGPAPVIDHPRFGMMRASFLRESEHFVWSCLDLFRTARGLVDLEFEGQAFGPTAVHEQQLDALVAKLDQLTCAAAKTISARLPISVADPASVDAPTGLEWQGARLSGCDGTFQLHFWCTSAGDALITVCFEQWRPVSAHFHD